MSPVASQKRKGSDSALSKKAGQRKRRNPGPRKLKARKAELGNQLGNLFDWALRQQNQSSDTPENTAEQRKRDESLLEEAVLSFGSKIERVGQEQDSPNQLFRVSGMLTTIRDYQAVGAAFMLRQERSRKAMSASKPDEKSNLSTNQEKPPNGCRGGILADEMGIGKTVQSIACMLAHPPSKRALHAHQGATLIIVPSQGLIKQWTEELLLHAGIPNKRVCKYGGKMGALAIEGYPYVLATYSQVERDFRLHSSKRAGDEGPLFEVEFYRIILDEGDNIKNYHGSTSKACCELNAQLKWVLSGTPLRNDINECFPYFRFLGIDINEESEEFVKRWKKPETDDDHGRTMQVLANIMFRREASQTFLGRNMCNLPKSYIVNKELRLTDEEAAISKHLERAMLREEEEARKKAKDTKTGVKGEATQVPNAEGPGLVAPKSNYQTRTTRLRQAVDHPCLVMSSITNTLNKDELANLRAELIEIEISKAKVKNENTSSDRFPSVQPGAYSLAVDIRSRIEDILSSYNQNSCIECFGTLELHSLGCGHDMCQSCYLHHSRDALAANKQCKCPRCDKIIPMVIKDPDTNGILRIKTEAVRTSGSQGFPVVSNNKRNRRGPGDDYNGYQPQAGNSSGGWLEKRDEIGEITSSTKTNEAISTVMGWQEEKPNDKIVIFSEWIDTLRVLGRMLNRAKVEFVYYSGHISAKERERNLQDFKTNPAVKVMVASMAAGGVGLNLTVANRMIIMNPWWNFASDAQAFGRIKRHGQTKETYLVRLFAAGTIDERLLKLQIQKGAEIKDAMTQGKKPKLLSAEERYWLVTDRHAPESPLIEADAALSGSETEEAEEFEDDYE